MLVGLKQILPKVYAEAVDQLEAELFTPAPLMNTVVTSDNGLVLTYRFVGSGTWTKQSNQSFVCVFLWNGGCGGGSGSYGSSGGGIVPGLAGGGGAGGNSLVLMLPSSYFASSTTITVGAGGNGGASQTGFNQSGFPGSVGGQSFCGALTVPLKPAGVGGGGRASGGTSSGGTAGSSSYVMSGGYSIADGTSIGSAANTNSPETHFAYNPADTVIGGGPIQLPCLPFAVATGGGSGGDTIATAGRSGGTPGGSIFLFGQINTMGGLGAQIGNQGGVGQPICGPGTYLSWPYGGILQNWYPQMFVTGGTGGGGPGQGATQNVNMQQSGGPGGIGAGGGGGAGRSSGGAPPPAGSGVGGRGGNGMVIIYEFV